jgi:hypothetical protein
MRRYTDDAGQNQENSIEQEFRNHLKGFLMRVHPDFFSRSPKAQEENDRSLKQLNQLLDLVEDYSKKPSGPIMLDRNRVPGRIQTTFYLRPGAKTLRQEKQEAKIEAKTKESESPDKQRDELMPKQPHQEFEFVRASYTFPQEYFDNPFPRENLERDVRLFLNDLLKQAGLPTMIVSEPAFANEAANAAVEDQFDDDGSYRPRSNADPYRSEQALRKELKGVMAAFFDRHYPVAQMAVDKLGVDWELRVGHKGEAQMALGIKDLHTMNERERKQLHYAPDLDGEQRAFGLLLVEQLWEDGTIPSDIPVYITKQPNLFLAPEALPGFISIPLEFNNEDFKQYLEQNLKPIMVTRYNIRAQIQESEYFIKQLTETLKLATLDVRTKLEHALICLSSLNTAKDDLFKRYRHCTEGMVWHIVDPKFSKRATFERAKKSAPFNPENHSTVEQTTEETRNASSVEREKEEGTEVIPIKRGQLNLSKEDIAMMADLRAKRRSTKVVSDKWDDEDEDDDESDDFLDSSTKQANELLDRLMARRKVEKIEEENEETGEEEEVDEFAQAMKEEQKRQSERINSELIYAEGTPVYSLEHDILFIPFNTTGETLFAWFEANQPILHFRQKLYPSKVWIHKIWTVCKNLALLLGVKSVSFSGKAIWDKGIQLQALKSLEQNAKMIRIAKLKNMCVIITASTISVNMRKKELKLPYNLTPAKWSAFLRSIAAKNEKNQQMRRRMASSSTL